MKRLLSCLLLLLFFSCQNNANNDYAADLTDSTSVYGLSGDSVKLVKTAGALFKVTNVEQSTRAVSELAQRHGGRVYELVFQSAEGNRKELRLSDDSLLVISTAAPQADVTVRVPSQNLEAFLFAVADLGCYTTNSNLKLDDRSLLYLQNALKQKARAEILGKAPAAKTATVAAQQQALALSDQAVDHLISAKTIDADAAYSTVNLGFFQNAVVKRETIANYAVADYRLPFGQRLANALSGGWNAFLNFLLMLLQLWTFVLLALMAFAVYKTHRSKKKPAFQGRA